MRWPDDFINKVIHGDCLEVMKDIPDKSVDLVLTDPPYGINYEYLSYIDSPENLDALIFNFIPEVLRFSKRSCIFSGVNNICKYPQPNWIISWYWKGTNTFGKAGYNQWQPILLYGDDIKGFGSINGQLKSDTIYFEGGNCSEIKNFKNHPCPKNIEIIQRLLARFSNEGDLVLDCFLGSGTLAEACKKMGRRFIGIEKEKKYCEIAERRLAQDYLFV